MKIFITDGSPASFYTAVFDAFREKDCVITSTPQVQLSFDSEVVHVSGDSLKYDRVMRGIAKYDKGANRQIVLALRSCDTLKEQTAFEYIKKLM